MLICPNMSNPDVAREFNELKSALMAADPKHGEAMAYQVWSLNNGNAIDKAPNGAESQLFKSLVDYYEGNRSKAIITKAKTYSTNFLKWFGNWTGEKDALPEYEQTEVSKVVDENGEPLVVWHGGSMTRVFDTTGRNVSTGIKKGDVGSYFTTSKHSAENYENIHDYKYGDAIFYILEDMKENGATEEEIEKEWNTSLLGFRSGTRPFYLSIKNAKNTHYSGTRKSGYNREDLNVGKNDGQIITIEDKAEIEYVVFSPNQIKHVDNLGAFNPNNPDIYHNLRGVDSSYEIREELLFSGAIKKSFNGGYELVNQPWAIQQVRDVCKKHGMLASTFVTSSGKIKIRFVTHEGSLLKISTDKIPQTVRLDPTTSTIEELTKEGNAITELVSFLKEKFHQLEVEYIFPSQLNEKRFEGVDKNTNSFVKGNRVYLIRGRVTSEIAAEELLHPLVYTVSNQNWNLFQDFVAEAKRQFPKLAAQIEDRYTDARGFNEFNRQLELVTQVLARHVNKKFNAGEKGSKLSKLIDQFFNYIGSLVSQFVGKFTGKDHDFDDIKKITLSELADIILAEDSQFKVYTTWEIQHNLSNRQQAAQDEANRLITRMNVLYRQYEKIKDKTPSQERLANQIFETLNRLKQHRDISAIQIALDQAKLTLGQYNPATGEPVQVSSIYKYLYDAQQNGFSGISPQSLVDMYRNSIKFYKDLIDNIPSEQNIDLTPTDKNSIAELKSLIEVHIMPLWTQAIMTIGDQIVDDQIDSEVFSSEENKEDMKKVAKDWLHKNLMYGDINVVTSYVYNYSNSSNPIIKQAFHLIQAAEQKTLEEVHEIAPKLMKAYQKANTGTRSFTPGWQSMMMEFDDKGIPTGNFVRNLNYGLYQKDFKEFLEKLNEDFIRRYGYTYVVDDTGAVTNSLTGEFAEDEEWGSNGETPKYIEYLLEIERFKGDRVFRRYQPQYYIERLSRPYDGTIDPMSIDFKGTRFHHGLSPKTLARYTYYQSNINYYLNKCQDSQTGLVYPERLSSDDQLSLDRWKDRLDKFTSIFNDDGSYKIGEDLKMAYEVRAWQKWIGEHNDSDVLQDDFNAELNFIKQESIRTNNPKLYNDFIKYNSRIGINPDFIKQTVGDMKSGKTDTDTSLRGKLLRASLQGMVSNPRMFGRELKKMENNPLFWLQCKASDQAIEDANDPDNKSGWDKDKVEAFQENFYQRDLLYVDEYGFFIDENGNKINPNDPSVKSLEDAGKLLTFRSWLINKYTDEAFRTGQVNGLIDESTGQHIDFSGMSQLEIRNQISNLLSYKKTYWDEDGNVDRIENEPLTIFSVLAPTKDTFFNSRTNRNEPTIIMVGDQRFKDSHSSLQTTIYQYNPNNGISELPNKNYDNGRYDNSEAYNKVMNDDNVRELYELLIQTMQDMQNIYSTNRKFNYKLPQINASTIALFSRIIKRGYSTKSIQGLWNSMTNIEANDELLRTKQDYFVGVDGEVANDVPLKFIRELKNKEDLTTDIVSSVIMFVDMALNYKNKSEVDAKLKVLRYNMDEKIREVYESKLKPKSEQAAKENKNSLKMFDSMMDVSMYGNKFGNTSEEGPSRVRVALHKTADVFQGVESNAMLGLNMFSMMVGFGDSLTRIFAESAAGKYMTIGDCLWALAKCLYYTPACIKNMFNPLANNKMTALMQMNGISKGTFATYTKADWGKGRKFLTNILMGGWSMLDWMANALLMTAFYHNCRLYEGNEIPKGFYTKYEMEQAFLKAGKTKADGKKAFHNYAHLCSRITLWDAYGFSDGRAFVKPEYEAYVTQRVKTNVATKTKKRGALYNGMNPDNDVPRWKRDVIGRLAGALRAWIQQQIQHLIAGGTDNIVRTFIKEQKPEVTTSGTRMKTKYKKEKLTDEQRSRQMAWDYETGTPQDQIMIGLFRSFKTLYKQANQALLHKPRTAKLSEVEKYAWKDTIIFLAMLSMMMVAWTSIHDWAREVEKPQSREDAGPASMLNPVDYYEYVRDIYIPREYYRLGIDDIFFRVVEAKISSVNVQQVLDIVNALTALKSGFDNQLGVIELSSALIGDEDEMSGILKQGGYKFYTKGEKALYKAVGPVNNLHTFLTYYGATGNLRWYTNKFGKLYRAFGYDFKTKDKAADNKKAVNDGEFSSGGFDSGGFEGGGFSGGDSF